MVNVVVNGVPLSTGRWSTTTVEGWWDTPGVEVPAVQRLKHGAFAGKGRAQGRTIHLAGSVRSSGHAEHEEDRQRLAALVNDGDPFEMSVEHAGRALSATVQVADQVMFDLVSAYFSRWQLSLYAPDPFLYGPWRESILRPVGAGVGLEFPLLKGGVLGFGSAVAQDEVIWNDGNATAYPQLVVTADAPGGFTVSLGSARVTYPYPTVAASPVVVDMTGSVTAGGADVSDRATASWAGVEPGGTAEPGFELLAGGTGFCVVKHRDTYI